jgi:ABC-2 type transport system ATP-binding protein
VERTDPVIEAEGLRKSFGTTTALDGVDLSEAAGRVLALLGPNGAGKTTLVRILSTLIEPDAGWARVAGFDTVRDAAALRSVIGLTGQFSAVDEFLTGRETLEMLGELHHLRQSESRRRAAGLLEEFGLADAADRPAKTYSGGMRRRLDLAASLIGRPPVLILDEPTTGLDPKARIGLWASIDELVSAGTTVLLTTQYLEEADRLAQRIVVIDLGHVVAEGLADELKDQLGGDVIELRVAELSKLELAALAVGPLAQGASVLDRERQRVTVPAPDGAATLRVALRYLEDAAITVEDIGLRRPSLDEVFLALTGHTTPTPETDLAAAGAHPNRSSS